MLQRNEMVPVSDIRRTQEDDLLAMPLCSLTSVYERNWIKLVLFIQG